MKKTKKFFIFVLSLILLLPNIGKIEANSDNGSSTDESLVWDRNDFNITNDGKTIGGRTTVQTEEGSKNVSLEGFTAKGKEKLKKNHHVVIPDGIEEIASVAFNRPDNTPDDEYIEQVTFPKSLRKIAYGAFNRQKIKGTLEIPEGVTDIGAAFISNEIEKVILPSTLKDSKYYGLAGRAFQANKISEVVFNGSFKDLKTQIIAGDQHNGPFDNQKLGEFTMNVGDEFKNPFTIKETEASNMQNMGGFMVNGTPTLIEHCDFFTKKDDKYIATKPGKYEAQYMFYDFHNNKGNARPIATISFTLNIVQNHKVSFMDGDKLVTNVDVEHGKTVNSQMPQNPVKDGFTFKGWNTDKNGDGEFFTDNTIVLADVTVYAIYTKNAEPIPPAPQPEPKPEPKPELKPEPKPELKPELKPKPKPKPQSQAKPTDVAKYKPKGKDITVEVGGKVNPNTGDAGIMIFISVVVVAGIALYFVSKKNSSDHKN